MAKRKREVKFVFTALNRTQRAFRGMLNGIFNVRTALTGLATAAFAFGSGGLLGRVFRQTESMNDLADATNITAKEVQTLVRGLKEVGQEGAAEDILGDLAEKLTEVSKGSNIGLEVLEQLRELGFSNNDIERGINDTFFAFERLVELASQKTFEQRNFPLKEIFGDEGARAIQLLIGEFGTLDGVVERFGSQFRTKAQLDATEEAFDSLKDAMSELSAVFEDLVANNSGDLTLLVNKTADLVRNIDQLAQKRQEFAESIGRGAFEARNSIVDAVQGSAPFRAGFNLGQQARAVKEGNINVVEAINNLADKLDTNRIRSQ